ncbi:hypothetical protein QJQ45_014104 [Haematococcus lacustris]|nr:hypothetical protein QJQ45_014104 [Haematococcus lacustris]
MQTNICDEPDCNLHVLQPTQPLAAAFTPPPQRHKHLIQAMATSEANGDHDADLFVIGAGSGGTRAARIAAQKGARVIVAELPFGLVSSDSAGGVGGCCVLRGCVPKKLMLQAAMHGPGFDQAHAFGWRLPQSVQPQFDWAAFQDAKRTELQRLSNLYRSNLQKAGAQILEGSARLVEPQVVEVNGKHYKGSGYIGCEQSGILARLGAATHLVFRQKTPLKGNDEEVRSFVSAQLQHHGIRLHPCSDIVEVRQQPRPSTSSAPSPHTPPGAPDPTPSMGPSNSAHASSGEEVSGAALLTLVLKHLESGEVTEVPDLDMVLLATGRAPRTKGLGLEELGVQLNKKGGVEVDKFCTSVSAPWLHAIGDVSNRLNLTPVRAVWSHQACMLSTDGNGHPPSLGPPPPPPFPHPTPSHPTPPHPTPPHPTPPHPTPPHPTPPHPTPPHPTPPHPTPPHPTPPHPTPPHPTPPHPTPPHPTPPHPTPPHPTPPHPTPPHPTPPHPTPPHPTPPHPTPPHPTPPHPTPPHPTPPHPTPPHPTPPHPTPPHPTPPHPTPPHPTPPHPTPPHPTPPHPTPPHPTPPHPTPPHPTPPHPTPPHPTPPHPTPPHPTPPHPTPPHPTPPHPTPPLPSPPLPTPPHPTPPLQVATMEGEVLAKNIFGLPPGVPPVAPDYDLVPTAVFTWPPFASVGLTEEAAVEKYGRVDVYVNTFRPLHASIASAAQTQARRAAHVCSQATNMGEDRARSTDSNANGSNGQAAPKDGNGAATGVSADGSGDKGNAPSKNDPAVGEQGFVKVLVDGSGSEKIVGVHMVAPEAPDIMTYLTHPTHAHTALARDAAAKGVALALKLGATKAQLDSVVGIHPTVGEELVTMKQLTRTSIKQEKEGEGKEEERGNDGGKRKEGEKEQAKVTG